MELLWEVLENYKKLGTWPKLKKSHLITGGSRSAKIWDSRISKHRFPQFPCLILFISKKEIKELGGNCWGIIIPHSGSTRVGLYALSGMTTRVIRLVGNDQGLGYTLGREWPRTRIYGWSGLCAMSVTTTRIICLVGSDQGLGNIWLVGSHQDP
jgi:hypothetical protein